MILHDTFGAQEPRNVSPDCKTKALHQVAQEPNRNQRLEPSEPFPVLLVLGLFENTKDNLKNAKDFPLNLANPETLAINRNTQKTKDLRNENTKEKKDRVSKNQKWNRNRLQEPKPEQEPCPSVRQ